MRDVAMTLIEATVECPVFDSFRVQQVAGLFDVPLAEKVTASFAVDVPSADEAWDIGLVVGPSGSGKSTIARRAFAPWLVEAAPWPEDRAVIDCFGELPARDITGLLTSVGFGSPPAWVKPYAVLSGGERFRCDLARALAAPSSSRAGSCLPNIDDRATEISLPADESVAERQAGSCPTDHADRTRRPLVVFDEFTSVVDRQVAQFGSAAIAKAIRSGRVPRRFVAVSCHYDVREWLEPDWVVDMATRTCQRRRLRRPEIELEIYRCRHALWPLFAPHHYLSGGLSKMARTFVALWRGAPVSFCATLPVIGRRGHWRISRIVTLPDYQGIGVGMRVAEAVAAEHIAAGQRLNITASHPAVIAHCRRSPRWRAVSVKRLGSRRSKFIAGYRGSTGRAVASFEYLA
jgi:GNAT superfamily N-acetyltransferase